MPVVRIETTTFGATRSHAGGTVETIRSKGASASAVPTGASVVVFGPVESKAVVVVKASGCQIYAAWGVAPVAGPAPAACEWISDGSYAIVEMAAGESLAVVLASL